MQRGEVTMTQPAFRKDRTRALLCAALLLNFAGTALLPSRVTAAPEAIVDTLMTKDLANVPGKEITMLSVTYPPGGADPVHRHNAHALVYVLEGTIVMGVKGSKEVTLKPGQTFYEGPDDVHTVGRNASSTRPAKFVVFLLKDKGAPALVVTHE